MHKYLFFDYKEMFKAQFMSIEKKWKSLFVSVYTNLLLEVYIIHI